MEEWTAAVSQGAITAVAENIITVHTRYFCGSVTVIRTEAGLVFIDTAKPDTAGRTLALVRTWDGSPVHTVIYTHGHTDHTSGRRDLADGRPSLPFQRDAERKSKA
jgi:glyoxylase-like metal-dependent hydrolase (beta-lactamase superfamily II)